MDELVKQCRDCIDCLCGDCKYEHLQKPGNFVLCMNALLGEAADAIEELSAIREEQKAQIVLMAVEDKPRWIPVAERLPDDLTFVLAVEDGTVFMAHCEHYYDEEEVYVEWHDTMYHQVSPTHWMPIPPAPREEV